VRCLCVCLNAAVDTTYRVDRLQRGGATRVLERTAVPGGKGINVARVLDALGHEPVVAGFAGGHAGAAIERGLREQGIETALMAVPGESRTCLAVLEQRTGEVSELLEGGLDVAGDAAEAFLHHAETLARDVDAVAVSGSLPAGLAADYYARLLARLRPLTDLLVLDTGGEPLRHGLAGRPDLIKPNRDELRELLPEAPDDPAAMGELVRGRLIGPVLDDDARVLITLGAGGAVLACAAGVLHAAAPEVAAVNPVGAGDATVAGYIAARLAGAGDAGALARSVAAGAASTLHPVAGAVTPTDIDRLLPHVDVPAAAGPQEDRRTP
jgi:tagatose 6-phosphate kinase